MRKALDRQQRLDRPSVSQVSLNLSCRNETIPILRALQHIYITPRVREPILKSIAQDVNGKSSAKHGRPGLSYWEILVLAGARLGCNYDYDQLQDLAENHRALRQIMGIGEWESEEETKRKKRFEWRRIEDNLTLLSPGTIQQINQAIVEEGHRLSPEAAETVRGDSFVAETNIHYPTDSSLIVDGLRKVLGIAVMLAGLYGLIGWRQHKHLYRKARRLARKIDRIAARKGNDYQKRMKKSYRRLLEVADTVLTRAETLREIVRKYGTFTSAETLALDKELETFVRRTRQVCDLARRRVLEGETIPNSEKLFSIFETHTQLYKRGKAGEPMQFGRLTLVYEDGAGFITHYYVLPRDQGDRDVVVDQTRVAQQRHKGKIRRASFDRGFHSPEIQNGLAEIVEHPCVPMPGCKQSAEQEKTASVEFRNARQSHPGIESAIGALQSGNGLKRCRDRSEKGFERYIGLGVLGRNLHVLGRLLIAREAPRSQAAQSRRKQAA
jgi:transposase, IS5 family